MSVYSLDKVRSNARLCWAHFMAVKSGLICTGLTGCVLDSSIQAWLNGYALRHIRRGADMAGAMKRDDKKRATNH